ncbi:DUF948 domain-containing protein [Thermophilibacter sp.]
MEQILPVALVVLACVGVWAVVEIALTMRSARRDIDKLTASATEVIEQTQPVVAKLDGIADELEPAAKRVAPLLDKTTGTVGTADESLARLNGILQDVSSVSGAASSVTDAVKGVAESAASGVAGVVSRLRGDAPASGRAPKLDGATDPEPPAPADDPARGEGRYVDYDAVAAAQTQDAGEPAGAAESQKED